MSVRMILVGLLAFAGCVGMRAARSPPAPEAEAASSPAPDRRELEGDAGGSGKAKPKASDLSTPVAQ